MQEIAIDEALVKFGGVAKQRLSQALEERDRACFHSIAALPSNAKAVEACLLLAGGLQTFVAVVGPSGWGKTHVLEATAKSISRERGVPVPVRPARELLDQGRTDASVPLILDDVQEALGRTRLRQQVRTVLDRRVRSGLPTLLSFNEEAGARSIRGFLPYYRDWTVVGIEEPSLAERSLVVRQLASTEGLVLAPQLLNLLAQRVEGNARTLLGALQHLKLIQSDWTDRPDVLRALGTLKSYWGSRDGWDLKDFLLESTSRQAQRSLEPTWGRALSVYLVLHRIGLSEAETAQVFGLHPGEAYRITADVAQALASKSDLEFEVEKMERALLESL